MRTLPFRQVDVFTARPFKGNPVAVVLEADGLSDAAMQAIANWTNLSETTFACKPTHPEADYRLRIFTPRSELPFAGHPTIGSAHALLDHGLKPRRAGELVQECAKGLVRLRIEGEERFLALPAPRFTEPTGAQLKAAADALGIPADAIRAASIIDVGPVWFTLQLEDAAQVNALSPDMARAAAIRGVTGLNVFGLYDQGPLELEVRSFAPGDGVPEDPVCGSGNGCVAALVRRDGLLKQRSYRAGQGRALGRDGRVAVRFEGEDIWLGGHAVTCVEGTLRAE